MKIQILNLVLIAVISSACQPSEETGTPDALAARARQIAVSSIIVDTHIDVPSKLVGRDTDLSQSSDGFEFDYPRAVAGGLNAAFMSIYTSARLEAQGASHAAAERLIDTVESLAAQHPDKFAIALSPADVRQQFENGLVSLPMGMENGSPLDGRLDNVWHYYQRGIRYISLAHDSTNHLSDAARDQNRRWNGLSDFGVEVVREMNRLGIMVDVSHLSDAAFWQVLALSTAPVIASHSSARQFTPGFERNLTDDMIRALGEHGGVIQINFGSGFIEANAEHQYNRRREAYFAWRDENPGASAEARQAFLAAIDTELGPFPYVTIDQVIDHFDHVVALIGIDHVGIGSDFDGLGDTLPVGLKDVSSYPNLVEGFLRRGYREEDIRKILGENLLRVWADVEAHAAQTAGAATDQAATTSSST